MNDLSQYDELEARFKAAYSYHESMFRRQFPQPQIEAVSASRLDLVVVVALVVLVIASVIVSGSRTVLEFGGLIAGPAGQVVGGAAFIMLEIALVIYGFYDTKKSGVHSDRYVKWAARVGLGLAFVVTVFANLHATSKAQGAYILPVIDGLVLIFVAISAPTLALISGHILGSEVVSILSKKEESLATYRREKAAWEDALNKSWNARKEKLGFKLTVEREAPVSLSAGVSVTSPDALTPTQQEVWNYLELNPSAASLTVREVVELTGKNRDAVNKAMQKWKAQNERGE